MAKTGSLIRIVLAIVAAALAAAASLLVGGSGEAAGLAAGLAVAAVLATLDRDAAAPPPPADPAVARPAAAAALPDTPLVPDTALIEAIDDPLLLVEGQAVTAANAAAHALFGAHVEGEDVRLAIRHPAALGLLGGAPGGSVELVGLGDPGRRWEFSVRPLDGGRRLVRLRDRTEAHAAERMRVDFVANASHELRTPLATLLGFIETLEDANGPADAAVRLRFLGIMAGEARRMQRLIEDLMSLSRIEADKFVLPHDEVDLVALVREVVAASALDEAARARLTVAVRDPVPRVTGDRPQLAQLLHNLIGNALKYGRAGGVVKISLATAAADGMARLTVSDEGEGIAPEHLPRLTERFCRADPGRSRAGGGTGLGLSIVKHIVERHRGRLDIASAPGRGTVVRVLLPAAPLAPPPEPAAVEPLS